MAIVIGYEAEPPIHEGVGYVPDNLNLSPHDEVVLELVCECMTEPSGWYSLAGR